MFYRRMKVESVATYLLSLGWVRLGLRKEKHSCVTPRSGLLGGQGIGHANKNVIFSSGTPRLCTMPVTYWSSIQTSPKAPSPSVLARARLSACSSWHLVSVDQGHRHQHGSLLSAGIEPARLWHLVPVFTFCTEVPYECCDAEDGETKDGCVGFPVRRLSVPATRRRPDVLGISSIVSISAWS